MNESIQRTRQPPALTRDWVDNSGRSTQVIGLALLSVPAIASARGTDAQSWYGHGASAQSSQAQSATQARKSTDVQWIGQGGRSFRSQAKAPSIQQQPQQPAQKPAALDFKPQSQRGDYKAKVATASSAGAAKTRPTIKAAVSKTQPRSRYAHSKRVAKNKVRRNKNHKSSVVAKAHQSRAAVKGKTERSSTARKSTVATATRVRTRSTPVKVPRSRNAATRLVSQSTSAQRVKSTATQSNVARRVTPAVGEQVTAPIARRVVAPAATGLIANDSVQADSIKATRVVAPDMTPVPATLTEPAAETKSDIAVSSPAIASVAVPTTAPVQVQPDATIPAPAATPDSGGIVVPFPTAGEQPVVVQSAPALTVTTPQSAPTPAPALAATATAAPAATPDSGGIILPFPTSDQGSSEPAAIAAAPVATTAPVAVPAPPTVTTTAAPVVGSDNIIVPFDTGDAAATSTTTVASDAAVTTAPVAAVTDIAAPVATDAANATDTSGLTASTDSSDLDATAEPTKPFVYVRVDPCSNTELAEVQCAVAGDVNAMAMDNYRFIPSKIDADANIATTPAQKKIVDANLDGNYAYIARNGEAALQSGTTPADPALKLIVANSLAWTGRLDRADKLYKELLDTTYRADAQAAMANVMRWRGKDYLAIPMYRQILADAPTNEEARTGLAAALDGLRPRLRIEMGAGSDIDKVRSATLTANYRQTMLDGLRWFELEAHNFHASLPGGAACQSNEFHGACSGSRLAHGTDC